MHRQRLQFAPAIECERDNFPAVPTLCSRERSATLAAPDANSAIMASTLARGVFSCNRASSCSFTACFALERSTKDQHTDFAVEILITFDGFLQCLFVTQDTVLYFISQCR